MIDRENLSTIGSITDSEAERTKGLVCVKLVALHVWFAPTEWWEHDKHNPLMTQIHPLSTHNTRRLIRAGLFLSPV